MQLLAIGGDKRYAYMVREANKRGIAARAFGLERAGLFDIPRIEAEDIGSAPNIVMPNPFGRPWSLPYSSKTISRDEVLSRIGENAVVFLFGRGDVRGTALERNRIIRLDGDETLMTELAGQTAEGAVHSVCERAAYELYKAKTLIIGYGRIAKALHRILNGYGADVTVVARREASRKEAEENSARAVGFNGLEEALGFANIIFSTPPERVIDARLVGVLRANALLVDLSGEPYGVDIDAARSRWLHAWREPQLPGRYCAFSAGKAVLDAVERALEKERELS